MIWIGGEVRTAVVTTGLAISTGRVAVGGTDAVVIDAVRRLLSSAGGIRTADATDAGSATADVAAATDGAVTHGGAGPHVGAQIAGHASAFAGGVAADAIDAEAGLALARRNAGLAVVLVSDAVVGAVAEEAVAAVRVSGAGSGTGVAGALGVRGAGDGGCWLTGAAGRAGGRGGAHAIHTGWLATGIANLLRIRHARPRGVRPLLAGEADRAALFAGAGAAVDRLPAVVGHAAALPGAGLSDGFRRARRRLFLAFALAFAILLAVAGPLFVPLLASLAPPLGIDLIEIEQGHEATQHRERRQQAEQAAAGASLAQGASEPIEVPGVHSSSNQCASVTPADEW